MPTLGISGIWVRPFGRADLHGMFGEFVGLEKISRTHLMFTMNPEKAMAEVRDPGSKNGTTPAECVVGGKPREIRLADVITLEVSSGESQIGAGMPSPGSLDEWMDFVTASVRNFTESVGWTYQIRRSWLAREKPVSESDISDYEWKIIPSLDDIEARGGNREVWSFQKIPSSDEVVTSEPFGDGLYYTLRPSLTMMSFFLEHSNDRTSPDPGDVGQWLTTGTIIPFGMISRGSGDLVNDIWSKGTLEQYLAYLCQRFDWNHYSLT